MYSRVIIITSLLTITCGVKEFHSHHTRMNFNVKKSWLKTAEFAKYLQLSLNVSRCTNVHIDGTSETTIEHLKSFVKIYPNTYTVSQERTECTGYLMISTAGTGLDFTIQFFLATVPTFEMLIIVDQPVNESSELLNPTRYGNANVKIMSPNGRWCLSKNYLTPRIFKKVHSIEELNYDTGIANLEGRELLTAAYDDPPRIYKKIGNTVKGFSAGSSTDSKNIELDGVNVKLFIMIAQRLNATYEIRSVETRYSYTNRFTRNIVRETNLDLDVDITKVSNAHWKSYSNYRTIAFGTNHVHFLVPRPKLRTSFWAPFTPFSPIVWISIVIMLIAQSLFVNTKARLLPTRVSKKFESFTMTWLETMGRLLNTTAPKITQGFKITFQLWSLASMLLLTAYSSDLASKLTSPSYEKRIDTVEDFIEANLTWGSDLHKSHYYNVHSDYNNPYFKKIKSRYLRTGNHSVRHEKILKGNYAIIGTVIGNVFFPDYRVSPADLKGYRVMKQTMSSTYTMLAVQPWLQDSVNKIILLLSEYGFVDYHQRNVILRHTDSAYREVLIEHDDKYEGPRVLSLKPLSMCFVFIILGLLVSMIVFILEVLSFTGPQKSVLQVLVDIAKNREISNFREEKKKRVIL